MMCLVHYVLLIHGHSLIVCIFARLALALCDRVWGILRLINEITKGPRVETTRQKVDGLSKIPSAGNPLAKVLQEYTTLRQSLINEVYSVQYRIEQSSRQRFEKHIEIAYEDELKLVGDEGGTQTPRLERENTDSN